MKRNETTGPSRESTNASIFESAVHIAHVAKYLHARLDANTFLLKSHIEGYKIEVSEVRVTHKQGIFCHG